MKYLVELYIPKRHDGEMPVQEISEKWTFNNAVEAMKAYQALFDHMEQERLPSYCGYLILKCNHVKVVFNTKREWTESLLFLPI